MSMCGAASVEERVVVELGLSVDHIDPRHLAALVVSLPLRRCGHAGRRGRHHAVRGFQQERRVARTVLDPDRLWACGHPFARRLFVRALTIITGCARGRSRIGARAGPTRRRNAVRVAVERTHCLHSALWRLVVRSFDLLLLLLPWRRLVLVRRRLLRRLDVRELKHVLLVAEFELGHRPQRRLRRALVHKRNARCVRLSTFPFDLLAR